MNSSNNQLISPNNKNKNTSKKTVPPSIIPITLINQTGLNSPSDFSDNENDWQTVQSVSTKRIRSPNNLSSPLSKKDSNIFVSTNRFSSIAPPVEDIQMVDDGNNLTSELLVTKSPKPPPIFIVTEIDFNNFATKIKKLTEPAGFECKTSIKGLKLQTHNSDSYRAVVKFLKENSVAFHSFQNKENKPFRVVIKNLHPSTDISFIRDELKHLNFQARSITNVLQKQTKTPLPMFFIDLEPDKNNSDIFKLTSLCFTKIKVETPHVRRDTPQCLRCQSYVHTRAYCNHKPRCVRCGDLHDTSQCTKSRNEPAKCALCGGPHPANYKGCSVHKDLNKTRKFSSSNPWRKNTNHQDLLTSEAQNSNLLEFPPLPQKNDPTKNPQVESSHTSSNPNNTTDQLASFLKEFKLLINPLISLLTTVIEKLICNNVRQ